MSSTRPPTSGPPPSSGNAGSATVRFAVEGMHCASCTALVEESLEVRAGVASVSVDLDAGQALVSFDPAEVDVGELASIITEAGYPAAPIDPID